MKKEANLKVDGLKIIGQLYLPEDMPALLIQQ